MGLPGSIRAVRQLRYAGSARSWNEVKLIQSAIAGHFNVQADGKILKGPSGNPLAFPSEHLAMLFAGEWAEAGVDAKRISASPVTSVTYRAHSLEGCRNERQRCLLQMARYLKNDTLLFWNGQEEPLRRLQQLHWRPLIDWYNRTTASNLSTTYSLESPVGPSDAELLTESLLALDHWRLAAFELSAKLTRSAILPMALRHQRCTVEEALGCSSLEERHQTERWGEIAEHHSLPAAEHKMLLGLADVLFRLPPCK